MHRVLVNDVIDATVALEDASASVTELLSPLSRLIGADSANFSAFNPTSGQLEAFHTYNHDAAADSLYGAYYYRLDPVTQMGFEARPGRFVSTASLGTEWRNQEYYQDFLAPLGIRNVHGIALCKDSTSWAGFGFQSTSEAHAFSEWLEQSEAKLLCRLLVASYQNRRLAQRLVQAQALAQLWPEREAVIHLSATGVLADADAALARWLTAGPFWRVVNGALRHTIEAENERFRRFLLLTMETGEPGGITLRGDWGEVFAIRAMRIDGSPVQPMPSTLAVRIERRDLFTAPSEQAIADLFGLTKAEARLTRQLLQGHELAVCAEILGVSRNTVRKQLASIMAKTSCSRQSELVRLASLA